MADHYVTWLRLTHGGRRSPHNPVCFHCGESMTEAEITEYNLHWSPRRLRLVHDHGEARRLYLEATGHSSR